MFLSASIIENRQTLQTPEETDICLEVLKTMNQRTLPFLSDIYFIFYFQNVLKESVSCCLVDNSTEVIGDHVGIWDRPKRTTTANAPTGGAYMIDVQNHIVLARNIKVCYILFCYFIGVLPGFCKM